jgi:hypothetical protein
VHHRRAQAPSGLCERLDDCLGAIEVPVIRAEADACDSLDAKSRNELGCFLRGREARGHADRVLHRNICAETLEGLRLMRDEGVAATTEHRIDPRLEPLLEASVEGERVASHHAVEPSAPLLPHASRLNSRGAGADALALVHDDASGSSLGEMERNRQTRDSGPDDRDVAGQGISRVRAVAPGAREA